MDRSASFYRKKRVKIHGHSLHIGHGQIRYGGCHNQGSGKSPVLHKAEKARLPGKALFIDLFKSFKMVFNTLVILRILWLSRMIYERDVRHWLFSPATGQKPMQKFSEWERPWHGSTLAFWFGIWPIAAKKD